MSLSEWLDRAVLHPLKRCCFSPCSYTTCAMKERLPYDTESLTFLYHLALQLNDNEHQRFGTWDSKAGVMLSASGLLIPLAALTIPMIREPKWWCNPWCYGALVATVLGLGILFLASWNAFMALYPRPFCVVNDDDFLDGTRPASADNMLREATASAFAAYRNNVAIINDKATRVIAAYTYFLLGVICLLSCAAFLLLA